MKSISLHFFVFAALLLMIADSALADQLQYSAWINAEPDRADKVKQFEKYLSDAGAGDVVPTDQVLLNASDWRKCKLAYPYSFPPEALWPHVVPTLKFIKEKIVPKLGEVSIVSGYREAKLNTCAHGAPKSAHAQYYALDLVPKKPIARAKLISEVCKIHSSEGKAGEIGLGFYPGLRFHIDSKGFRRWGPDFHSDTSPCLKTSISSQ